MSSLKPLVASGVKWTAMSSFIIIALAPLFQIIKVRFLDPEGFAYIAIIMLAIGFMNQLEGVGFNQGVIQKDEVNIEEASSLFIFNLIIAAVMAGALFTLANPLSIFFELPKLHIYIQLVSIMLFLSGPKRYFRVFLQKYLLFKEIAVADIARQCLLIIISTCLFVLGWGVLGFIVGHIISSFFSLILIIYFSIRNKVVSLKLFFSISSLQTFIRFGAFVSGRSLLNYFFMRIDEVAIGYLLEPDILGIYYFGKSTMEQLRQVLNRSYGKVLFPLFSKLKHDIKKLSNIYLKITHYLAMLAFPLFIGIALTAESFVPILFGGEWKESVIVFQVFAVALIFKMLHIGMSSNILYTANRPETAFYIDIITDLIYFAGLLIFATWGLHAILIIYSLYIVIKVIAMQLAAHRYLIISITYYLFEFKGIIIYTSIMAGLVWIFQQIATSYINDLLILIGSVSLGAFVYICLIWLFERNSFNEIIKLARKT